MRSVNLSKGTRVSHHVCDAALRVLTPGGESYTASQSPPVNSLHREYGLGPARETKKHSTGISYLGFLEFGDEILRVSAHQNFGGRQKGYLLIFFFPK